LYLFHVFLPSAFAAEPVYNDEESIAVYEPVVTITALGGNEYQVKIEVWLPKNTTGGVVSNTVNGDTRSIDIDIVGGVPINGPHLETYSLVVTRLSGENEILTEVFELTQGKPKKKKGQTVVVYSGVI